MDGTGFILLSQDLLYRWQIVHVLMFLQVICSDLVFSVSVLYSPTAPSYYSRTKKHFCFRIQNKVERIKQDIKGYVVDLLRKALEKFLYSYALTAYLLRKKINSTNLRWPFRVEPSLCISKLHKYICWLIKRNSNDFFSYITSLQGSIWIECFQLFITYFIVQDTNYMHYYNIRSYFLTCSNCFDIQNPLERPLV